MMQLLVIVLNKLECLDKLLTALEEEHIPGATILDSRGMAQQLEAHDELRFLGSLRMLMNPAHKENKMIFMVLDGEKVRTVSRVVNEVTGGLDQPDSRHPLHGADLVCGRTGQIPMNLNTLLDLAIMIFAGMFCGRMAKHVHLPNVTGYLVAGLLIGRASSACCRRIFSRRSISFPMWRWASLLSPSVMSSKCPISSVSVLRRSSSRASNRCLRSYLWCSAC